MLRERLFGSTFLLTDNNNDDNSQLNIHPALITYALL